MIRSMAILVLLVGAVALAQTVNPPKKQSPPAKTAAPSTSSGQAAPRARVATNVKSFELAPPPKVNAVAGVIGASRGTTTSVAAVALAPKLTRLYGSSPRFSWSNTSGARQFAFELTDEDGNEVFHDTTAGSDYQYPADAPKLRPGSAYYWSVEPLPQGSGMAPSEAVGFVVLTGEERDAVDAAAKNNADPLARARAYRAAGLWYDAVGAYSDLIREHPSDARLYRERSEIFAQIPATAAAAKADSEKASALSGK